MNCFEKLITFDGDLIGNRMVMNYPSGNRYLHEVDGMLVLTDMEPEYHPPCGIEHVGDLIMYDDTTSVEASARVVADVSEYVHIELETLPLCGENGGTLCALKDFTIICDKTMIFTYDIEYCGNEMLVTGGFVNVDTGMARLFNRRVLHIGGFYGVVITHETNGDLCYYDAPHTLDAPRGVRFGNAGVECGGYRTVDSMPGTFAGYTFGETAGLFEMDASRKPWMYFHDWIVHRRPNMTYSHFPDYYRKIKTRARYEWSCGLLVTSVMHTYDGHLRAFDTLTRRPAELCSSGNH